MGFRGAGRFGGVKGQKRFPWTDLGDFDKYRRAVAKYEPFDYSKPEEALFIVNGKVIKFFADAGVVERRVKRQQLNPQVFPPLTRVTKHFYSYPFQPGKTLYQTNNPRIFAQFLEWLQKNLWKPAHIDPPAMATLCRQFYQEKTTERLARYYKKHAVRDGATVINGQQVPPTAELLGKIPWERVCQGVPTFFHGDLQFDNILYNSESASFTLLDWRDAFAGRLDLGDQYYDFAKLYGGIFVNYDYIKSGMFNYSEDSDGIWLDFARRFQAPTYLRMLEDAAQRIGLDIAKIRLIVCLIYINMAPLHHYPYDKFLYSLGRMMLHQELQPDHVADRVC